MTFGNYEAGLYESLHSAQLNVELARVPSLLPDWHALDAAELPQALERHLVRALRRSLRSVKEPDDQIRLTNELLHLLQAGDDLAQTPGRELRRLSGPEGPGSPATTVHRPATPLSAAALLTNAPGEPALGTELRAEILSADRVDLLCAFVKWHGLRLLETQLADLRDRGRPLRVITTTYMGATERRALDRLVRDFGAQVKVHYDAARTRLHAKAWLFERRTGFDTAYVGSSNLSKAALLDGVEWNVRLSAVATPSLLQKFRATFDSYWADAAFEDYDPDRDAERLDEALALAGGSRDSGSATLELSGLEVRPFSYQEEILEALRGERALHDRHRNLVVAATGTGKTVIAALDYRGLVEAADGRRPSLLFVAHRQEILQQARRTYREVLADASFGELYVAGERPTSWRHVFASIQSLTAFGLSSLDPTAYDVVVIDEFHHAEAATYRLLLERLRPRELLGLTATPERADGLDVRRFFDGRTAAELRLWDALGADLLCPFHYFAVADGTDLRAVEWKRGAYDVDGLSNLYSGNDARARIVLGALRDKVLDPLSMRALGFCVSVDHAQYMARVFREAGIPALAVSGATPRTDRAQALRDLADRTVNVLFAADLFNEGLDLPDVDTVLFLRPTESSTVFLQQLGRGLRRTPDKAVLTVLDFVGYHRKEFRFDDKLRALTGAKRGELASQIEKGFPHLPAGCQIVLDRQSQEIVLANVRSQLVSRWNEVVALLRQSGPVDLSAFLQESGLHLADVLRKGSHSWTRLRRDAGQLTEPESELERQLLKRVRAFSHVNDRERAAAYERLLSGQEVDYGALSERDRVYADMLFFSVWNDGGGFPDVGAGLSALRAETAVRSELRSVVELAFDSARHVTRQLPPPLQDVPLQVHGRYQREEVLLALGYSNLQRRPNSFREGVLFHAARNVDALFVTLNKSEADYSPTTLYQDYPVSPTLFHWESQSTTTVRSTTGQRYLSGSSTVLLFVREDKKDEFGTAPYLLLGPCHYVQHSGERPISITWRLEVAMPSEFFNTAALVAQ